MTKPIEFVAASRRVREILEAYDQSNRLMIDQVYGQLSPTLDDFYEERLTVLFPDAAEDGAPDPQPTITLTRVIPAGPTRLARNLGSVFPLQGVVGIVLEALACAPAGTAGHSLHVRLRGGVARLAPKQFRGSQTIMVMVMPDQIDVETVLA